ncbi:hypothetical protein I316_00839 [Kwoniella heveanensis BCC8398]|uniref:Uncharacterized protein n=1 Tax=Kwoniella heveanensis BCC8398 TaxID=1296120 RepID=A0A1B9H365_9TREE|nr:hypothetical protein I316_00839 [Kwoniella heveanensis BCC8398]
MNRHIAYDDIPSTRQASTTILSRLTTRVRDTIYDVGRGIVPRWTFPSTATLLSHLRLDRTLSRPSRAHVDAQAQAATNSSAASPSSAPDPPSEPKQKLDFVYETVAEIQPSLSQFAEVHPSSSQTLETCSSNQLRAMLDSSRVMSNAIDEHASDLQRQYAGIVAGSTRTESGMSDFYVQQRIRRDINENTGFKQQLKKHVACSLSKQLHSLMENGTIDCSAAASSAAQPAQLAYSQVARVDDRRPDGIYSIVGPQAEDNSTGAQGYTFERLIAAPTFADTSLSEYVDGAQQDTVDSTPSSRADELTATSCV